MLIADSLQQERLSIRKTSKLVTDFNVRFLPEGQQTTVPEGETLLEAARKADVYVGAICGGEGVCGKCRVIVREGEVEGKSTEFLTRDEILKGYVLACQVVPQSDLVVEVPVESRLVGYEGIGTDSERFSDFGRVAEEAPPVELEPIVEKYFLTLSEPTLDDPTADQERLLEAVTKRRPGPLQMGLKVTRDLPEVLRTRTVNRTSWTWAWHGQVTAAVGLRSDVNEVLYVEQGDTTGRSFGLALDIGTTTVVGHLVDMTTGVTVEAAAKYNSQIKFGADVINRINHARQPGGADALHQAVIGDIEALIDDLVERTKVGRGDIQCVVAAGNTSMLHFLLNLQSDLIRLTPFVPSTTSPPPLRAAEIGLRIHPRGILYVLPMVGSFVGGDITAGILTARLHEADELSLLLDIGTNGEVVLGNKEFTLACSASAGPAFEGGSVTCGMRATSGAIDKVAIDPVDKSIDISTIDGCPPVGLCGTGLIDVLAQMFRAGIVDRSGRFQTSVAGDRLRQSADGMLEYLLVAAAESGGDRDIVISQSDVENLIRTKGSIYAAADSLVQSIGLSFADVEKVYIAGAFGNKLDVASCITIGLLPEVPPERIEFIGNSCVAGAKAVMLSHRKFEEIYRICQAISYQELMVDPAYMDKFTSACFLPHTDVSRFPLLAQEMASTK